jgi:beta-propeller repeat-containing protein
MYDDSASIPSRSMRALFASLAVFALPAVAATNTNTRPSESYGKLPLHFEANRGQAHKDVRFLSRGPGYNLYLTANEAVLVLSKPNADVKRDAHSAKTQERSLALRMSLVGAARQPIVSGIEEQPGKANYFIGRDPAKWRTDVPIYAKVRYENVYPGIDLVYYGNQRQLEYDFVVAPGADPQKIVLSFKGADKLEIGAEGDLVLHAAGGDIRQNKPVIYQKIDGVRREIDGRYVIRPGKRVGFQLAAYDTTRPLIIDPVVLAYSTYLGGGGWFDGTSAIAVDADGNAYVTGATNNPGFPTTTGAFESAFPGGFDPYAFVTKLNPSGSALVYSTYLGSGSGYNFGRGIAVDAAGNAYVAGETQSSSFPTTPGAFQRAQAGTSGNAFVTKLDPTGSALVYSTYLGGSSYDTGTGIAVDSDGNAYITGNASSDNFPTTLGAFQPTYSGHGDAFVTKLNPTGSMLVYSTYLGGSGSGTGGLSGSDNGNGIAVDAGGNAYVTGRTFSADFPTTAGAFQTTFCESGTPFVTKLDPTGSALVYSTFLGNPAGGAAIALDADGNAYVTGSAGANFTTTAGAFQLASGGGNDAFVTKLNSDGSALVYSTYLGGSGDEGGNAIAVDAAGNAYVTGTTNSTNFPTTPDASQATYAGGYDVYTFRDAFVTKLDPTGSVLVYSTYLGGNKVDSGFGIAVDGSGNAYVTGSTNSGNFPTTPGTFQATGHTSAGYSSNGYDAFVAKFSDVAPPPTPTSSALLPPVVLPPSPVVVPPLPPIVGL